MVKTLCYWIFLVYWSAWTVFKSFINICFIKSDDLQYYIHKKWGEALVKASGSAIEIIGIENIDLTKNYVFASNHQSMFDIFVLAAVIPVKFCWISKGLYFKIPGFGWVMRKMGFITMDRKNVKRSMEGVENAIKRIKELNRSVAVFPEGTRSRDGKMLPFKRGSIRIAVKGRVPIIPTTITGTYNINQKGQFAITPQHIRVIFAEPIRISPDIDKKSQGTLLQQIKGIMQENRDRYSQTLQASNGTSVPQ